MKWVADQPSFDAMMRRLEGVRFVAVDTEADSLHSYFDKVCLIQLSAAGEDFIIDPLSKIDIAPFGRLLSDPNTTKILHGADYDLRILNRDFGFTASNLVDTMVCAQLLGYEAIGLAALLKKHFGLDLDKSHQRADWAMRPLPPRMLEYAATDTRHLVELSTILRRELESVGRWEWASEEFARLETIRFRPGEEDPEAFRKIKGSSGLEPRGLAVLFRLHSWRDHLAQAADRPPFKVASNEMLVEISRTLPKDFQELTKVKGVSGFHSSRYGKELLRMVHAAMQVPEDQLPERTPSKPWIRDRQLEAAVERLKKIRDRIATDLKIDPAVLAPKHVLTAIAVAKPSTLEDLKSIPAMREWQRRILGPALTTASQTVIAFSQ